MKKVIIARWGEIHLKGGNKDFFVKKLKSNLSKSLEGLATVKIDGTRLVIDNFEQENKVLKKVIQTFGIVSASISNVTVATPEAITQFLKNLQIKGTFKVTVNRACKSFPVKSMDFAATCGGVILDNNPQAKVDVINPDTLVHIDIRESNNTYISDNSFNGPGGLPVGVSGKGIVLLSGGIDSPTAAFQAAKRGLAVEFIHFATPPYTSQMALDKVERLVKTLEEYVGKTTLYVIPFTQISKAIQKHCDPGYMITIMRRYMIRIAEQIGKSVGASCIITGENLAQVASQTIQGIASNNFVATTLPILRPLITYDKYEIIDLAKRIGTYETSIEPHQDCCTVFVPAKPVIKPDLKKVEAQEAKLKDIVNLEDPVYNRSSN